MTVFDLCAKISLDSKEYESGLKSASEKTSGWGSKLKSAAGVAAKGIAAASAAVTAVAGAAAAATTKVAQYGDNIDKMSQKLGMSAEAYQEWDFILQHSGASIDSMQASMKTLSNAAVDGKDAFQKLGISIEDAQSMSQEDLFGTVVEKLQGMEEGSERTAIASDLLGKSATELGALLNTSAEDTEAMRQQVHDLGGVMSNDSVKAAAAFQDSLQNLKTGISGFTNGVVSEFMPSITTVMDGLTALVSGDSGGMAKIEQGISDFTAKLPEIVNRVLPALTTVASSLITGLVSSLSTMLPVIVDSGGQLLMSLLQGIIDNAPKIIDGVVAAISAFIDFITDNLPMIVEMGIKLIVQLAVGLVKAIPKLIAKIPEIIVAIIKAFQEAGKEITVIGVNIVKGLWNGIKKMASWIKEKVTGFFDNVVGGVKKFLGIHSPSRVFAEIGKFTMLGFGVGVSKTAKTVAKTTKNAMIGVTNVAGAVAKTLNKNWKNLTDGQKKSLETAKEDYKKTLDDIKQRQSDFAKSVKNFTGLFDAPQKKQKTSAYQMVKNQKSQLARVKKYASLVRKIGKMNLPAALKEELIAMGVDGVDDLATFVNMAPKDMKQFVSAYKEKAAVADKLAASQFANEKKKAELSYLKTEVTIATNKKTEKDMKEIKGLLSKLVVKNGNVYIDSNKLVGYTSNKIDKKLGKTSSVKRTTVSVR